MDKDKPQYLPGMIMSGGGNLLGMIASMMTIMIAARLLSQEELGAFFLVMLLAQFTVLFGDIGLQNTAIKRLTSLTPDSSNFTHTSQFIMTIAVLTSMVSALGISLFLPFTTSLWPYQHFQSNAFLAAPIAFLTTTIQISMSVLVGAKQFRKLSVLSAGMEILRAILSAGGLLAGFGVNSLLWGMVVSRLIGIGLMWRWMPAVFVPQFHHPQRAEILKFGGWLYGCSLVSVTMVRASDAILTTYLGTAALAVYSAAMQIPSVMQRGFESVRPAFLGYLSTQQSTTSSSQGVIIRIAIALLTVTATFLIALAKPLMTLLYSAKYEAGVSIMQALSVWAVFTIINYLYTIILIGNGESRKAFMLTVPQLCVMLATASFLVPHYEGFGAAIALITTAFFGNLLGAWMIGDRNMVRCGELIIGFLRAAIPLLLFLMTASHMHNSFTMLWGGAAVTLIILFVLKAIRREDITVLQNAWSRTTSRTAMQPNN